MQNNYNHKGLTQKLKELRSLQDYELPDDITEELDFSSMKNVLSVVGTEAHERSYTPLVNKLMAKKIRVPLNDLLYPNEKKYIIQVAEIINKHYGAPEFNYDKVSQADYPRVDNGINLIKTMSPLVTPGASQRRFEGLMKFHSQKYKFKPDGNILVKAIAQVAKSMFKIKVPADDLIVGSYKSPFEKHTSNVGGPYYKNEKKLHKSGLSGKEYTVKKSKEWLEKYGTNGIAVVPATIIGRDQQGGLDINYDDIRDVQDLAKQLDRKDILKPSKARVVWSTPRVANNCLAPVVHPVTEYLKENSPLFCGYLDRPARAKLMQSAAKITKQFDLKSANVDYSSYDLTVSPELIVLGAQMLSENIAMSEQQIGIFGSIVSNFIGTPYVSMDPFKGRIVTGQKRGGIPSGSILTNLLGSVVNAIASTYAKMRMYGVDETIRIDEHYSKIGAPSITVLGDDVGTGFKRYSDIQKFAEILKEEFNFDVSGDGNKTAYGVFFLQERHMNDGKILYPTPRSMSKSLGVERPKGLNGTLWDLGFASKLANMDQNPDLVEATALLQALDKTLLGLQSPEGVKLNAIEFAKWVAHESEKHDTTALETLYDGDPSKIDRFNVETGQPSKKFLSGYFDLLNKAVRTDDYFRFQKKFN